MKKYMLLSLLFISSFLPFSKAYGNYSKLTAKEDIEIEKLKEQIKLLENKITQLEEVKKTKLQQSKKDMKIGLALSGGGAKGLAHIGVLRVLEELGIRPDYITGTSMGAVVGVLYSVGYTPDEIEAILTKSDWDGFINGSFIETNIPLEKKLNNKNYMFSIRYDNKFNFSLPKGFGNNQMIYFELKKLLNGIENIKNFDELPIPVRVIATDLNTGKAVAFKEGDLAKAVTASVAIPTIFDPIKIDGKLYVDGLVSRNFPVVDAFDMGADFVIGSDVGNELKDKEDYNIISVLNQLVAIQSASSTDDQKKLASILISPDVLDYSATDLEKGKELALLGEKAARKEIPALNQLKKSKKKSKTLTKNNKIFIENIVYKNSISAKDEAIINSILDNIKNRNLSPEELENYILKVYGNDIINKIYYEIDGHTLVIDADINPNNSFGVSMNYLTGYGTTFDIGTTISNFGKLGNNTLVDLQVGDYIGFDLKNFLYYGYSNKIGIFANLGYEETPLFIYDGDNKISDSLKKTAKFETGILTQYNNQLTAAYGINSSYTKLEQETGSANKDEVEYSKNYNGAFWRLSFDNLNSIKHATSGIKGVFEYNWEGSFDKSNSNYYGPLYVLDGYVPISKKFTFNYGIYGGMINGDNIDSLDKYIRLGGTKNNLENKDFAFYGYHYQQKLVDEFLIGKLSLEYELDNNIYLSTRWNIGTFNELNTSSINERKKIWENYDQGFGIALLYESLLGPFEFSISRDNQNGDILSQISIGYTFD